MNPPSDRLPSNRYDARCPKCGGTGLQGTHVGGNTWVHPLGASTCTCRAPTSGTHSETRTHRVWTCPCGRRIEVPRTHALDRNRTTRASAARLKKAVCAHLRTHAGRRAPPVLRFGPVQTQALVAENLLDRVVAEYATLAEQYPHAIHIVHDSVIVDVSKVPAEAHARVFASLFGVWPRPVDPFIEAFDAELLLPRTTWEDEP